MVLSHIGLTGATGMLGSHLRNLLESCGVKVICTSSQTIANDKVFGWDLSTWLPREHLDSIFQDVQALVHVGAMVPDTNSSVEASVMFDANVRSCINIGDWAVERNLPVIYVSGAIVYRHQDKKFQDESAELGWNDVGGFYGYSKLLGETALSNLRSRGLNLAVVRPSSIYGYGLSETKMVRTFLDLVLQSEAIELYPPFDDEIDFIHALDVSRSIIRILETETWDTFNISSSTLLTVSDLARACVETAGRGNIIYREDAAAPRKPLTRFSMERGKARAYLNWEPSISIEQGLKMMVMQQVLETG